MWVINVKYNDRKECSQSFTDKENANSYAERIRLHEYVKEVRVIGPSR